MKEFDWFREIEGWKCIRRAYIWKDPAGAVREDGLTAISPKDYESLSESERQGWELASPFSGIVCAGADTVLFSPPRYNERMAEEQDKRMEEMWGRFEESFGISLRYREEE